MAPISEIIFSGFVSKAVNDIVDISKYKIKEAVRNKNIKHQNMESQIYNVIVDVFNNVTNGRYKNNQDNIYDATEGLLKSFKKSNGDELKGIKSCLRVLNLPIDINECMKFKVSLYEELGKEGYSELFRAILLLLLEQKSRYDNAVYEQLNQKLDEVILILNQKEDGNENSNINRKIKSRTQEYADKWNENMFLNDFDKRDQCAGINVKLRDVYLEEHLPHYIWKDNDEKEPSTDLKELLSEYINEKRDNKMLLVLGQPGIGKSTLITWITANFSERIDDILVYRFASDLKDIDWNCTTVNYMYWPEILKVLDLTYDKLDGKILIFDGFDEISVRVNRLDILNKLLSREVKSMHSKFSLIITCRENCIYGLNRIKYKYITLKPWNSKQIESFCKVYSDKVKCSISKKTMENILKNWEILGIPLILYMVLALNISIEKEGSIIDVYDKIFSLDGGIYDRCIDNKNFENKHRISEIKKQIHQVSREIAIWMFENNSERAFIPEEHYQKICVNIMQKREQKSRDIQQDLLIGSYFKLVKHCEGVETERLYFVHRSIYEYFVVETIYSSIENAMNKLTTESQEELAGNIAIWLKQGHITNTIGQYLQLKILKIYNSFDCEKKGKFYEWWEETFDKMISNGMFYYTKGYIKDYKNIIDKEIKCFLNLMKILRLLYGTSRKKYILENVNKFQLEKYIRFRLAKCRMEARGGVEIFNLGRVSLEGINLSGADIKMANLRQADLRGADLSKTDLSRENLQDMDLGGANLEDANLQEADLRGADITGVNLRCANLQDTIFDESQIGYLMDKYNLENSKVYICSEKKVISYEIYCKGIKDS